MRKELRIKGLVVGIMLLFLLSNIVLISSANERTTIYVDDDNTSGPWDGTIGHPYQYIQDGVDNANSGDIVFVRNGTYTENIIIDVQIALTGENKDAVVLHGTGYTQNTIYVIADNVVLNSFTIIGNHYFNYQNSIEEIGILMFNVNNVNLENINISGTKQGIFYNCVQYCNIIGDIYIFNCFGSAIHFIDSRFCGIYGENYFYGNYIGINIENSWKIDIYGNNHISYDIHSGIDIWDSINIQIANCHINNNNENGIQIYNQHKKREIRLNDEWTYSIFQNVIYNNNLSGIFIDDANSDCIIEGNAIYDNGRNGDDVLIHGISILRSYRLQITSNYIYHNQGHGLYFEGCWDVNVSNNKIKDNIKDGIYITNDVNNYTIMNNTIFLNTHGIVFVSSYNTINGNHLLYNKIYNNTYQGISINNQLNMTIEKNRIWNNQIGIQLDDSKKCRIKSNDIINNNKYEVVIGNSKFIRLYHNNIMNDDPTIPEYFVIDGFCIIWAPNNYWNIQQPGHPRSRLIYDKQLYPFIIFMPLYRGETPLDNDI